MDDLFDYDVDDINDPFSENYVVPGSKESAKEAAAKAKADADLGIDKKLEITRQPRAPRVKLDEDRYAYSAGCLRVELTVLQTSFSKWYPEVTSESKAPPKIQRQRP